MCCLAVLGDLRVAQFFFCFEVDSFSWIFILNTNSALDDRPWWHYGHLWLVIAGPAIVVVAGFVTLYLAVSSPNEIVTDKIYQQSMEASRQKGLSAMPADSAPALQARNHTLTGEVPLSK